MLRSFALLLTSLITGTAFSLSVTVVVQNQTCSYLNGSCYANAVGGVPPYTYLWNTTETTAGINGLASGTYSVTVTDFVGTQAAADGTVVSENYPDIMDYAHPMCVGQVYHAFFMPNAPLGLWPIEDYGPWTTSEGDPVEMPLPTTPGNYYLPITSVGQGQAFNVSYWDVNGCQGQFIGTTGWEVEWPTYGVLAVEGSCADINTGSITFSTTAEGNDQELFYVLKEAATGNWNTNGLPITGGAQGTYAYSNLAPGDYWLVVRTGITYSLVQGGMCASPDSIFITVPSTGVGCGVLSGSTYMDYDSDCTDTEVNVPNAVVEIQPGPYYATTNNYGNYGAVLPYGTYTVTSTGTAVVQSCAAGGTIQSGNIYATASIGHQPTVPLDISIGLASGPARPGFALHYSIGVHNLSSSASGTTTTTFTFDPAVSYIGATPTPTSVVGNTLTWTQSSLGIFQQRGNQINLQVPPNVGLIGTVLNASASVSTANTDGDLGNNSTSTSVTVTGSVDPNDKHAQTSSRWSDESYYIDQDVWVDYTIRFQNTGTDTAFNIVVTDTLPATLDPATISMVNASHIFEWSVMGQGVLRVLFPNILLPDSNVNEAASHGLVSFRIRPHLPISPGTEIENIANIFFDYNDPVITEPSVLTAEFSTGVVDQEMRTITLAPVPAKEELIVSSVEVPGLMRILAADGREVLRMYGRSTQVRIDLNGLTSGAYLLVAVFDNGNVARERFIKQ